MNKYPEGTGCCADCGEYIFLFPTVDGKWKRFQAVGTPMWIVRDGIANEEIVSPPHECTSSKVREIQWRRGAIAKGYMMDATYKGYEQPWSVACPKCGSEPEEKCQNISERMKLRLSYTKNPHKERSDAQLVADGLEVFYDRELRGSFLRPIKNQEQELKYPT